jgi:hypothetical protein
MIRLFPSSRSNVALDRNSSFCATSVSIGMAAERKTLSLHFSNLIPTHIGQTVAQFAQVVLEWGVVADIVSRNEECRRNIVPGQDGRGILIIVPIPVIETDCNHGTIADPHGPGSDVLKPHDLIMIGEIADMGIELLHPDSDGIPQPVADPVVQKHHDSRLVS